MKKYSADDIIDMVYELHGRKIWLMDLDQYICIKNYTDGSGRYLFRSEFGGNGTLVGVKIAIVDFNYFGLAKMSDEKMYAKRDIEALDNYSLHMTAMTEENLRRKGDIAAELAYRDMLQKKTEDERDALKSNYCVA